MLYEDAVQPTRIGGQAGDIAITADPEVAPKARRRQVRLLCTSVSFRRARWHR